MAYGASYGQQADLAAQQQQASDDHFMQAGQRALGGVHYSPGMEPAGLNNPIRSYLIDAGRRYLSGNQIAPIHPWIAGRLGIGRSAGPQNSLASQQANSLAQPQGYGMNALAQDLD